MKKIRQKIVSFLKQGITAKKLALTVAIGLFLGTIPLLGTTSLLCAAASLRFRLNMAVIQAVNYILYPLQLLLFIPFIQSGLFLFGKGAFTYSVKQIFAMLGADPWGTIAKLFSANILGVLVWLLVMPWVSVIVYLVVKPAFVKVEKKLYSAGNPPEE